MVQSTSRAKYFPKKDTYGNDLLGVGLKLEGPPGMEGRFILRSVGEMQGMRNEMTPRKTIQFVASCIRGSPGSFPPSLVSTGYAGALFSGVNGTDEVHVFLSLSQTNPPNLLEVILRLQISKHPVLDSQTRAPLIISSCVCVCFSSKN